MRIRTQGVTDAELRAWGYDGPDGRAQYERDADELLDDPFRAEHAEPMWKFWLMVSPVIGLYLLLVASQVFR